MDSAHSSLWLSEYIDHNVLLRPLWEAVRLTFMVGVWATLFCTVVVEVLERMPAMVWLFTAGCSDAGLVGDNTLEAPCLASDEAERKEDIKTLGMKMQPKQLQQCSQVSEVSKSGKLLFPGLIFHP